MNITINEQQINTVIKTLFEKNISFDQLKMIFYCMIKSRFIMIII